MASNRAVELNGGDDEEEALRQAVAMSLGDAASVPARDATDSGPSPGPSGVTSLPATSMSLLGLNRRKMEEERLARLKKRKAETDLDAQELEGTLPPARRPKLVKVPTAASSLDSNSYSSNNAAGENPQLPATVRLPYPKGTVLKTWVHGTPRRDDIKIEEVLQKDDLELAVLSSYQWDEEWLMAKLNMGTTRVLLIAFAPDEATMVFLIDLPRIEDPAKRATNALTPFGAELQFFLKAQGVEERMVASLQNYDFSETSRYGFLHTMFEMRSLTRIHTVLTAFSGGSHSNMDVWQRTGYCGLGRTVKALGLDSDKTIDMDYICSSIGAVNSDLLTALYNACKGDSGMKEYDTRTGRQRKKKDVSPATNQKDFLGHIRVYYPSRETVRQSRGGTNSAGTISFQAKWWESEAFPSEVLRDCKNVQPGVLIHSKIIFVRRPLSGDDGSAGGWAYVGSHNLSESAWGRLVKDRNTGQPKLNARNWECGVLIPVSTSRSTPMEDPKADGVPPHGTTEGLQMLELFRDVVPIPIDLPGARYRDGDEAKLRPWFYQEN
ncbi:Tyrosyl-DNA phosphodiesterase 1 [Cytospora mali]|uniref:Tyrosyl-DNA phosphodiesterase 1 n=1 Tax=Cytospora mali TaxID=578113 RepID=A0A194VLB6_CYTMA|nr:Tyrosyl-DNA phosphodiesterase 1 [Valsa mali]